MSSTSGPTAPGGIRVQHAALGHALGIAAVILLCLLLFVPNLGWGLPGLVSWSQDSIAGVRTLGAVEHWPADWRGRYPPMQYLILSAAYRPWIAHWESTGERFRDPATGVWALAQPQAPKIATLLWIARIITACMGLAAAFGVYAVAWVVDDRPLVAALSAFCLVCGAAFTYFAHLDNVDVPSICWLAWSTCFYVRLLRDHRLLDAAALGLLAAFAVATKDSTAGVYPGMAAVVLVEAFRGFRSPIAVTRALGRTFLQPHWLLGMACFAVPCLYLNGAFHDFSDYVDRLRYWIAPPEDSLHARQIRYANPLALMLVTLREAGGAVGWPMATAMIFAIVHALRRRRQLAFALLTPAIAYWLVVILPIRFVYDRFLFPPLVLMGVLVAVWLVDLGRGDGRFASLRRMLPALILLPSAGYAVAVNLEMQNDSRYAAEAWFTRNVPREASVGAFAPEDAPRLRPQYLPRVHELGYATFPVVMAPEWLSRPQPEYLVLSSFDYEDYNARQHATMADLLAGRYGYGVVARFGPRFLGNGSHWLSLAGWGGPPPGKISPALIVLQRRDASSHGTERSPPPSDAPPEVPQGSLP